MLGQLPPVLGIFGAQRAAGWAKAGQRVGNGPRSSLWLTLLSPRPQGPMLSSNPFLPFASQAQENR